MIYCILSPLYGTVYVGMVELKGPRALEARFPEHILSVRALAKQNLACEKFYATMCRLGEENWIMVPLQICSHFNVLRMEKLWFRILGNVFNKVHTFKGGMWATLRGPFKDRGWNEKQHILSDVNTVLSQKCVLMNTRFLIRLLLHAQPYIDAPTFTKLQAKVKPRVHTCTNIRLPSRIAIPYAPGRNTSLNDLKDAYRRLVAVIGMHRVIQDYIQKDVLD